MSKKPRLETLAEQWKEFSAAVVPHLSPHSPAISGERTEQGPICDYRGVMSSPWHGKEAVGLSPEAKQRITEKIKQALSNGN